MIVSPCRASEERLDHRFSSPIRKSGRCEHFERIHARRLSVSHRTSSSASHPCLLHESPSRFLGYEVSNVWVVTDLTMVHDKDLAPVSPLRKERRDEGNSGRPFKLADARLNAAVVKTSRPPTAKAQQKRVSQFADSRRHHGVARVGALSTSPHVEGTR